MIKKTNKPDKEFDEILTLINNEQYESFKEDSLTKKIVEYLEQYNSLPEKEKLKINNLSENEFFFFNK